MIRGNQDKSNISDQGDGLEDWSALLDEIPVDFTETEKRSDLIDIKHCHVLLSDKDQKNEEVHVIDESSKSIEEEVQKLKLGCLEVASSFISESLNGEDNNGDAWENGFNSSKKFDNRSKEGRKGDSPVSPRKLQCLDLQEDYDISLSKTKIREDFRSEVVGGFSIEDWRMSRTFDKAIEGLRKLKEDPIQISPGTSPLIQDPVYQKEEDDDTYIISPFSECDSLTTD